MALVEPLVTCRAYAPIDLAPETRPRRADDHGIPYLRARRDQVIPYPPDQRFP